jgi:transposase
MNRRESSDLPQGRVRGRPRLLTPERVEQIVQLRSQGLPWREVAKKAGAAPETCRRTFWVERKAGRAVRNSHAPSECNGGDP